MTVMVRSWLGEGGDNPALSFCAGPRGLYIRGSPAANVCTLAGDRDVCTIRRVTQKSSPATTKGDDNEDSGTSALSDGRGELEGLGHPSANKGRGHLGSL